MYISDASVSREGSLADLCCFCIVIDQPLSWVSEQVLNVVNSGWDQKVHMLLLFSCCALFILSSCLAWRTHVVEKQVRTIQREQSLQRKSRVAQPASAQKENTAGVPDAILCKICWAKEVNVARLPMSRTEMFLRLKYAL